MFSRVSQRVWALAGGCLLLGAKPTYIPSMVPEILGPALMSAYSALQKSSETGSL